MYVPSFFTGSLINRFRARPVMAVGATFIIACVLVNLAGTSHWHFAVALVLLGVGWNFLFIGGTTLLTDCYRPEEKAKSQAANDFIVFSTVAMTALSSGYLHDTLGWQAVNLAVVLPLLAILGALASVGRGPRRELGLEARESGL
jgi:MFS family permease